MVAGLPLKAPLHVFFIWFGDHCRDNQAEQLAQKMKFSVKDYFSKNDQIESFLQIWSNLLKKSLMESFIFCAVCKWSFKALSFLF